MIKKKAKKSKAAVKKVGKKKRAARGKKVEKTPGEVRKELAKMVLGDAKAITKAVLGEGKKGQLATAKYVFEMAHIYPEVNDGSEATENEDCLAKTLLDRLNIPDTPVVADQDGDFVTIPARVEKKEPEKAPEEEKQEVVVG
jgi:sulfur carrier protein ThiS